MSEVEQLQNMNSGNGGHQAPLSSMDFTRIIGLDVANSTLKIWTNELNLK